MQAPVELTLKPLPEILKDPNVLDILSALTAAGEKARLVGGCVRDALLGITAADIDIATTALPEKTTQILEEGGFKIIPVGIDHGVVLAIRNGRKYEIAMLREDVQTDGRHAVVKFSRDWAVDAWRRDFTVNALSMDADGHVYDYTDGLADIRRPHIRFIGDPHKRIEEDYLRILRYYRFYARIGGEWDTAARAACKAHRAGMAKLSRERITGELIKLLSAEHLLAAAIAIAEDHILAEVLPTLVDVASLARVLEREKIYGVQGWPLRLAAWGGMAKYFFEEILLDPLTLPHAQHLLIKDYAIIDIAPPLTVALYHYGKPAVMGAVLLRASDESLPQLMQEIENYVPMKFPLHGEDLLQMGVAAGPRLGEILRQTEEWWIAQSFNPNKDKCLEFARNLASNNP